MSAEAGACRPNLLDVVNLINLNAVKQQVNEIVMSLVISDDVLKASGLSEGELLLEIVLMLFRQDRISLGKASELLGMHRMQFQKLLAERNICIHYDVTEFREDLKTVHVEQ